MAKDSGRRIAALPLLLILAILLESPAASGSAASTVKTDIVDESLTGGSGDADPSDSWATWAKEKITEGLGIKQPQQEEKVKDQISEAGEYAKNRAGDAKDSLFDAAKGGAETVAEKSGEAKEAAAERAEEAKESARKKSGDAAEAVEDKTGKVKEAAGQAAEAAAGKAREGYEAAKSKAGEKLDAAKEGAASSFGAAKEKVVGGSGGQEAEL